MSFSSLVLATLMGFGVMAYVQSDLYEAPPAKQEQLDCSRWTELPSGRMVYTYICGLE